jgi:hypothetical protein
MGGISLGDAQVIGPDVVEEFHLSHAQIDSVVDAEQREMDLAAHRTGEEGRGSVQELKLQRRRILT